MNYFISEEERKGTVYYEFQKGPFDGISFWKEDSILLSDDIYSEIGLGKLLKKLIPDYDDCDNTEINEEMWRLIKEEAFYIGGKLFECIREAEEWVDEAFGEYDVFTIIGL